MDLEAAGMDSGNYWYMSDANLGHYLGGTFRREDGPLATAWAA